MTVFIEAENCDDSNRMVIIYQLSNHHQDNICNDCCYHIELLVSLADQIQFVFQINRNHQCWDSCR